MFFCIGDNGSKFKTLNQQKEKKEDNNNNFEFWNEKRLNLFQP